MVKKKLAEEYALKEYTRVNGENDLTFEDNRCFTFDDIKAAFDDGRDSVIENVPELKWKRVYKDGPYLSVTAFDWFYRVEFAYNKFNLFCHGYFISYYNSLSEAKQAANEHYKQYIKKTLGL